LIVVNRSPHFLVESWEGGEDGRFHPRTFFPLDMGVVLFFVSDIDFG